MDRARAGPAEQGAPDDRGQPRHPAPRPSREARKPLARAASRGRLSALEAERLLKAHGFVLVRTNGSHHVWRRGSQTLVLSYRSRSELLSPGQQSSVRKLLA